MDFPLYEAPIEKSPEFEGRGTSVVSGKESDHCFRLGVGCCLRLTCPQCGTTHVLDCASPLSPNCRSCNRLVIQPDAEILITYDELRAGVGLITKDTEVGMVSWEQLETGWSHGIPSEERLSGFITREDPDGEDGWFQAKLDPDDIYELLRTPTYVTWQGECWLFHDQRPMVYVGEWDDEDFNANRGSQTLVEFYARVLGDEFLDLYEHRAAVCKYVFRSVDGSIYRGHFDFD
jgi:hypothetical protein